MVQINNLVSNRNCHQGVSRSTITGSKFPVVSHDFPVIFQVFRNIHEYANEVIYIYEHLRTLDERNCQIASLMIHNSIQYTPVMILGRNQLIYWSFRRFSHILKFSLIFMNIQIRTFAYLTM